MKIYIDENLPHQLAEGLHVLQQPNKENIDVLSIKNVFGRGCADETWLPRVGIEKGWVVTQDIRIHRNQAQRSLYHEHGVGLILFVPPSKTGYSYWDMVEQVVRRWKEIRELVLHQTPPYACKFSSRASKLEKL